MRIAYYQKKRIHITDYTDDMKGSILCHEGHVLIAKRGEVRVHHYAHKSGVTCVCGNNKGQWHIDWQDRVMMDYQEIRMINQGKIHIADIFTSPYVVEIQHSPMDKKEIKAREEFYTKKMGHKMAWVFDACRWEYRKMKENGSSITIKRLRGSQFPLHASYTGDVTLFLDFGKKELLRVTGISGSIIHGTIVTMKEFDDEYLMGQVNDGIDMRTFHHNI